MTQKKTLINGAFAYRPVPTVGRKEVVVCGGKSKERRQGIREGNMNRRQLIWDENKGNRTIDEETNTGREEIWELQTPNIGLFSDAGFHWTCFIQE